MSVQSREAKVFAALLVSMTAGAMLLMALGNNPPSAGAFCLNTYYQLDTVEKVISSRVAQSPGRWKGVEVYYSGTEAGNIEQLASLNGLAGPDDLNCHFVICNGLGGGDGQIQSTEKWQRQWSAMPGQTPCGDHVLRPLGKNRTDNKEQTIRICLIANGKTASPTDFQIKRVEALIEGLYRTFDIQPQFILYPDDWR